MEKSNIKKEANDFVKKYKNYLIGKKVEISNAPDKKDNGVFEIKNVVVADDVVEIVLENDRFMLADLEGFINGETDYDREWGDFKLIVEKSSSEKLTIKEQIKWLNKFIPRWEDVMNLIDETERFAKEGQLQAEYDEFLIVNNLPNISADDLVFDLSNELKTKQAELENINIEEKTAFNDAETFVEEYKDYLIGKTVEVGDIGDMVPLPAIASLELINSNSVKINFEDGQSKSNPDGITPAIIFNDDFEGFINGEIVAQYEKGRQMSNIMLIIQNLDEKEIEGGIKEELINQSEFKYYVCNPKKGFIVSGHEYREDAMADYEYRTKELGESNLEILTKKALISAEMLNPDDNSNWSISSVDFSIIEESINFGVTEGDYDGDAAKNYIEKFKSENKFGSVIKARLVYYMEHIHKQFKNAIVSSQYEKSLRLKETSERIVNELLNIIKEDI